MKKPVGLEQNSDGTWSAWIYSVRFTGTYDACINWLRGNGEVAP